MKILTKTAIVSTFVVLITSIITLYVFYTYLDHCAIEGMQMKVEDDVNGAGICLDFTDIFVIYFTIIPCLILCIWAYFFTKRNRNVVVFASIKKIQYWFLLIAFALIVIFGVLNCISTLHDLRYFLSIGGVKIFY